MAAEQRKLLGMPSDQMLLFDALLTRLYRAAYGRAIAGWPWRIARPSVVHH